MGISEWQVLTALDKLKSTGEIEVNSTNKFTVISLKKKKKAQSEQYFFKPSPTTKPQQSHNKSTHNNNVNNVNNVKNNSAPAREKKYNIYDGSIDWSTINEIINA